ncbi:tyrosine-type recombinase/integrase [Cerasicoccus frondis]|uniref:tyrosine-type recombinase/integrase n=1 Tax=Cerasicoccus frondis TaxID=490090 RepID=UPI0028528604|nr:site-specific integrase [Cerasicoccus frondis]
MGRKRKGARLYKINHPSTPWQVYLNQPGKKPIRKHYSDKEKAQAEVDRLNDAIAAEGIEGVVFGAEARADYIAAKRRLDPYDVSLSEVVDYWLERHPKCAEKDFLEAIHDFIAAKRRANRSPKTLQEHENRLKEFRKFSLAEHVGAVTPENCRDYLSRPHLSPASIKRYQATLSVFFGYCRKRGWMSTDPLESFDSITIDAKQPVILTPEEAARFMAAVEKIEGGRIARAVALRLFAGLRPSEQEHLSESDILKDGIRVAQGKIRGRRAIRIVPMIPTLRRWLDSFAYQPIKPANFRKLQDKAIEKAGLRNTWCTDILRHTWISYRLAETQNERSTAREAGNTPEIIYRHYYQLVTESDLLDFLEINPRQQYTD